MYVISLHKEVGIVNKADHVVEDFYIGKVHVKICDDFCREKSPQDVQKIMDNLATKIIDSLSHTLHEQEKSSRKIR